MAHTLDQAVAVAGYYPALASSVLRRAIGDEQVAELINLPDDHVMGPMVAIGKGTKDPWPKPGQLPLEELVVENSF